MYVYYKINVLFIKNNGFSLVTKSLILLKDDDDFKAHPLKFFIIF